ncbi:MAG TPA: enoyl-CoA hydratase/isomerase family protein [Quisquiliibacterium sp.]|nr:enoyl-CoA hydratase/isomerase family protein [Quisquiliibacterium sp.]
MPTFKNLNVSADGATGRLTLTRSTRLNALSPDTLRELAEAARWLNAQPGLKVVVVSGEGRAFCAGFDLDDAAGRTEVDAEVVDLGRQMAEAIDRLRAISIARIHGHCVGGGLVLAAACDLRVAAASARFSIPELDLGIPLAWGGIPRLVRELGPAMAKELVLTCRPFTAAEAHALHFLNRVVPDENLDDEVQWFVDQLLTKSSFTLTNTKRHVNAVAEQSGSTSESFRDAEITVGAMRDPESIAVMKRYLGARGR